ncbi:nucleoid occlusion protein [Clostridiaceae bacterium M8S5]|nr:nucleoid occlusion protein [Clostridiaceae bacterium M8S5]
MSFLGEVVVQVDIKNIRPNPYQPRKKFSNKSLEELSQSIKQYGVLQPISVRKINEVSYELVAGERRLRASEIAGLDVIPAIVMSMGDRDTAVIALIENLQREDLNFIEEAEGYKSLIDDHGFTQHVLAKQIGKNQSTIANKLRILRLSDEIKKMLIENSLTERHGRALLKLPSEELRIAIINKIIKSELTVKKTEELIKGMLEDLAKKDEPKVKQNIKSMINFRIYLNTIRNAFDAIKQSGVDAKYEQIDKGDFVEVTVKIPKNK